MSYDSLDELGIPRRLFVVGGLEPERILSAKTAAYHMGAGKFNLERKQGDDGIEYVGSFLADPYTGRDIGEKLVQNGYAASVTSYENNLGFGKPKDVEDKLDKSYIV